MASKQQNFRDVDVAVFSDFLKYWILGDDTVSKTERIKVLDLLNSVIDDAIVDPGDGDVILGLKKLFVNVEDQVLFYNNGADTLWIKLGSASIPDSETMTIFLGLSDDEIPSGDELTLPTISGVGTILAYVGEFRQLIARLASESDITSVLFSDDSSSTNQIGAFTKYGQTVIPFGQNEEFAVWVSNQKLSQPDDLVITIG